MLNEDPPPQEVVRAGHETRDLSVALVVVAAVVIVLAGIVLSVALWQWSQFEVPEQKGDGASPPTVMPGEPPVGDRVRAVPPPRLDPLKPGAATPDQHPEDLRADRQPELQRYEWVEKGKVARIPIDKAMTAVVEAERAKAAKKEGKKEEKK